MVKLAAVALTVFAQEGEGVEHAPELVSGGFFAETAWIMLVLPFVAFLAIIVVGNRMKRQGSELAVGFMAINFVWASVLFVQNMFEGIHYENQFPIADIGQVAGRDLVFELGYVVDGLSIMMYWVIAFVGLMVFIYAVGYMEGDVAFPGSLPRSRCSPVPCSCWWGAPNFIQLIVGWEGVGLASYLLIGHYWEQKENSSAAIKAFLTNKVADVGLILGAILVGMSIGNFRFSAINEAAVAHNVDLESVAFVGALLLFLGAMANRPSSRFTYGCRMPWPAPPRCRRSCTPPPW